MSVIEPTKNSLDAVQEMFIAYVLDGADPFSAYEWAFELDRSDDLDLMIYALGHSDPFVNEYAGLANDALINKLYQQLFNRDADPDGLSFYLGRIESGEATLMSIGKQIIDGVDGGDDAIVLANKVAVANCITEWMQTEYISGDRDSYLDEAGIDPAACEDDYYGTVILVGITDDGY